MSAELVPAGGAPVPAEPLTPFNSVTDIRCTACHRTVTVSLFEAAWSRPCPLCRSCGPCRSLCSTGAITHGFDEGETQ